jgi:hypothetical protein
MTLDEALAVLAANHAITEGSFLFALHERDRFDRPSFWELYNATIIVGAADPAVRGEELRGDAFWTYRNILMLVIWHFDPEDSAHVDDLPKGDELAAVLDRVQWGFHPLINGKPGYGWNQDFGDGLENPRQDVLRRYFAEPER